MSDDADPERIVVIWSPEARADLRAIDRETAMQILYCIDRYLATRAGDVKKLKAPRTGFRLRCGDYRVFFDQKEENAIQITGARGVPLTCKGRRVAWCPEEVEKSLDIVEQERLSVRVAGKLE